MFICNDSKCTGCMACVNACPKRCISMTYNEYGILVPRINKELCINCGKCFNLCPRESEIKL